MRLRAELQHDCRLAGFKFLSPGGAKRLRGVAQSGDLPAVECQANRRCTFVAGDNLNRQTESRLDHFRSIVSPIAGRNGAEFNRGLGSYPLLDAADTGCLGDTENKIVLGGHADVFELVGVEFDPRPTQELLQELTADKMADSESVRFSHFVN